MKKNIAALSALLIAMVLIAAPAAARDGSDGGSGSRDASDATGLLPGATADTCRHPLIENPYRFLGDHFDYVLAPDGSFEGTVGDGWLLDGGAATVAGNDPFPFRSGDVRDARVLSMPAGSTAISAPMCVDLNYPHFRLAIHRIGRQSRWNRDDVRLRVETMYPNSAYPRWRWVDSVRPWSSDWTVSDFLDLTPERGGPDPGGRQVSIRFTVIGDDGSFEIDDVYVDPRFRI